MASYDPYARRRPSYWGPILFLLPFLFLGIAALGLTWYLWPRDNSLGLLDPAALPRTVTARGNLAETEKATIALFEHASPSVVNITTLAQQQDYFSQDAKQVPEGSGSGFVWDDQGRIVTNYHVIRNAESAIVTFSDQSTYPAKLVGSFADKDLAVLQIDAPKSKLRPIPVGTSSDLKVGQSVFAIGNPFGLDQTLTTGIISAVGRQIQSVTQRAIKDVIQTDAAINPGNSGGPLLDSSGRLIGVNTAIYSPSGASAGIGFAIPVDEVNRIVPEIVRHGRVIRPGLGVRPDRNRLAQRIGVEGVMVAQVEPGGPGAQAGLRPARRDRLGRIVPGDVIIAINEKPVRNVNDMYDHLESFKVGDSVTVTVVREGEKKAVEVKLAETE